MKIVINLLGFIIIIKREERKEIMPMPVIDRREVNRDVQRALTPELMARISELKGGA